MDVDEVKPLWEVSRKEEQDARDLSRSLVLNRDRNPPTFQNGPCIAHWHAHAGFSTFMSIARAFAFHIGLANAQLRTLCIVSFCIVYIGCCMLYMFPCHS